MPELVLVGIVCFLLGCVAGFVMRANAHLLRKRCPAGSHAFIHLRGAYGYCAFCPARRRFLKEKRGGR